MENDVGGIVGAWQVLVLFYILTSPWLIAASDLVYQRLWTSDSEPAIVNQQIWRSQFSCRQSTPQHWRRSNSLGRVYHEHAGYAEIWGTDYWGWWFQAYCSHTTCCQKERYSGPFTYQCGCIFIAVIILIYQNVGYYGNIFYHNVQYRSLWFFFFFFVLVITVHENTVHKDIFSVLYVLSIRFWGEIVDSCSSFPQCYNK